jgi:AraC-like DNA-binding protein
VREFIRENLHENIKLQELAEVASLSPFHLNRVFRAQVGLPPHEFQSQLRIEKAAKLIAQKKSFAEIAFETGFADQSHFNRFFKRYTGVTPKRFLAR